MAWSPDGALSLIDEARSSLREATRRLGAEGVESQQFLAYELAHAASALETAMAALSYGRLGAVEEALGLAYAGEAAWSVLSGASGNEQEWGVSEKLRSALAEFVHEARDPGSVAALAYEPGDAHLPEEMELVAETFRRFATEKIAPVAQQIHVGDLDVPEEVISRLAETGVFGMSVPERYGGSAGEAPGDGYLPLVVATEELSAASLAAGGSLITRPEIVARAILAGGTEEQKADWVASLASGEMMAAIAVTEPDYGSDVAGIRTVATPSEAGFAISGTKTFCTFGARADLLGVLARTDEDRSKGHRGLSLFMVEKPRAASEGFTLTQPQSHEGAAGRMQGLPIRTMGYRGLHSYEINFDGWWVPQSSLVGGEAGMGRGFYYQMAGFDGGRLQTTARATGVMRAAYEAAAEHASTRKVFGQSLSSYQLTRVKLGRMASTIQACRQFALSVAAEMGTERSTMLAAMAKAYACRAAEWVTREAMQIHGAVGYAEESPVNRYFADARVLSIFEGSDEVLALRVVARRLAQSG